MSHVAEWVAEFNELALLATGFEEALLGVAVRCGQPGLAVYDIEKCIEILMRRDGMDEDEAREFLDFNTLGAWAGEGTPLFLHDGRRTMSKVRDYREEYVRFHGKPAEIAKRAQRNAAHAKVEKRVGAAALAGKDVNHKHAIRHGGGNGDGNLEISSVAKNRGWETPRRKKR